jgi:hypothetical protein
LIIKKEWLDEIYEAAMKFEWDFRLFFSPDCLNQYCFSISGSMKITSMLSSAYESTDFLGGNEQPSIHVASAFGSVYETLIEF